jgi:serine/threonine protein kinase
MPLIIYYNLFRTAGVTTEPVMRLVPSSLFDVGSCIGEGRNGKVYLLRSGHERKNTRLFAGKSYSVNFIAKNRLKILNELEIHSTLQHPHIVSIHCCFFLKERFFFVLDLAFSDFFTFLSESGPLSESSARLCLRQIIDAVDFIHAQGIIFSDIKPENILCFVHDAKDYLSQIGIATKKAEVLLKLTDFGSAQKCESSTALCGTMEYQAPEQKTGKEYTNKIDIYALGILLHECLTLESPLMALGVAGTAEMKKSPKLAQLSAECVDLFRALTETEPESRPSAQEAMEHPFFTCS